MIIYKATNKLNGKVYVGKTIHSLKNRQWNHKREVRDGSSRYFTRAIRKYGFDTFSWEVIDTATSKEELNEKEISWISSLNSTDRKIGYNVSKGGENNWPLTVKNRLSMVGAL